MTQGRLIFCGVLLAMLSCAPAYAASAQSDDFVTQLSENNIRAFIEEIQTVALAQRDDMTSADIEAYLNQHLAPKATYASSTKFEIPGYPAQETEQKFGKTDYIAHVLEGKNLIADYETALEIKDIKIAGTGRSATLTTVNTDKGKMPWPNGQGTQELIPIKGRAECEQKVIVSLTNYIQMAGATCRTVISFLPFGDKPLGE